MKTAVEYYNQEIKELFNMHQDGEISGKMFHMSRLVALTKAKEMEKEQIIKSVDYCLASIKISDDKTMFTATTAEQYYNETFKSEKQSYQDKMRDKINKAKSRIE